MNTGQELEPGLNPVETPVDEPGHDLDESGELRGVEDVLTALDEVDTGEDDAPETASGAGSSPVPEVDEAARKLQAQISAAVATGVLATVIEKALKPCAVTAEMRLDFAGALAPVLEKQGLELPGWLARLLDEWKAELELARKTVAIGYAIYEQRQAIMAGELNPPEKKRRYRVPSSMTTNRPQAA